MHPLPQGRISTFYSYKGGTGRTMALANVAWILASKGKRVLAIDWDLEAPGLHRYFAPLLGDPKLAASPGLIDFLLEYWIAATHPEEDDDPRWFERYADLAALALPVLADFPGGGRIDVIGAGKQDGGYAERVTGFDWKAFYASFGGAGFLDLTFERLRGEYDYVLIDSRTGVTDTAGICTVQLPDSLVVFFTLNNQSIEGASAIAHDAQVQRQANGGPRLAVFPVPSRIDLFERDKLEIRRSLVRERFSDLLDLDEAARKRYFAEIELLYVPFYSYEEQLATIVDRPHQHASLLGSLERLTGHVSAGEVRQLVSMSDARRADFRAKYDAFHRQEAPAAGAGAADERWDIFLSHAPEDRSTALALHRQLQPRFKTFFGVDAVAVGENIAETTARAMNNSHIAVILISRAALASASLAADVETLLAVDVPVRKPSHRNSQPHRNRRVLPVLIGVDPDELTGGLAQLRAYRALVVPPDEEAPAAAARAIITALGETPEAEPSTAIGATAANEASTMVGREAASGPVKMAESVPQRRPRWWWMLLPASLLAFFVAVKMGTADDSDLPESTNVFVDELRRARMHRKIDQQAKQLREAKHTINRERGLRATLLASDHAHVVEALVLGVRAVGDYDLDEETPPSETSTGLLAALTKIGSDATLRHVLSGHREGISTLLYSGQGSTIASVDGKGVIRIWDANTGKSSASFNENGPVPTLVALADDGTQIAWSTPDRIVHVGRVDANEEYTTFGALPNDVRDLTFWDEGANLAIATSRSVYVYELATGTERSIASKRLGDYNQIALASRSRRFAYDTKFEVEVYALDRVHEKELWLERLTKVMAPPALASLQILAGGDHLLIATQSSVDVHDIARNEWVAWLDSSLASRPHIATAAEMPVVAVGWPDDLTARVWSPELGARTVRVVDDGIAGLALADDGSRLAVLDRGGNIQIWRLDSLRRVTTVPGDPSVGTMVFGPDSERLVTGSGDGSARLWNLRQRKSWDVGDPGQAIRDLAWLGSGLIATANNDRVTRIWDLAQGRELKPLGTRSVVTSLTLVRGQGEQRGAIVITSLDGPTRLIDLDASNLDSKQPAFHDLADATLGVLSLAASAKGDMIALGDREGDVHLWSREAEKLMVLDGPEPGVEVLEFSPDGKWLATGHDRTVVVWELASGKQHASFEGHLSSVKSLVFSPDGKWLASSSGDKVARLWSLDGSGALALEGHAGALTAIAFSPDARLLVTASEDASARVWTLETSAFIELTGHAAAIRSVAVGPDNLTIVTSSDDATARIWRSDGTELATLVGHRTGLVDARLTDDGKLLVTASTDGDLRVWPTTPSAWLQAGCDELFERAEYSQVSDVCERVDIQRRQDKPKFEGTSAPVEVWVLDPPSEATDSKKGQGQYINRPPDPTGKPRGPGSSMRPSG